MTNLQTLIYCLFLLLYCSRTLRALSKKSNIDSDVLVNDSLVLKLFYLVFGVSFIVVWFYLPYIVYQCILTYIKL
jgi:hypothetical protein